MNLYSDQFSTEHDYPPFTPAPPRRYVIASTPRCGSHRLGHALAATGHLGFPLEYLNPANLPTWERRFGTQGPRETLRALWRVRTSPNGCFGLKLHYRQLAGVASTLPPEDLLGGAAIIRIRRPDLLGQAISLVRARQTGVWISAQAPVRQPFYDGDAIAGAIADLSARNAGWEEVLARAGIQPLDLTFEEVVGDPDGAVRRVAEFLEVDLGDRTERSMPQPRRQGDRLNESWRSRFLAEGRPFLPPPPPSPGPLHRIGSSLRRRLAALR